MVDQLLLRGPLLCEHDRQVRGESVGGQHRGEEGGQFVGSTKVILSLLFPSDLPPSALHQSASRTEHQADFRKKSLLGCDQSEMGCAF